MPTLKHDYVRVTKQKRGKKKNTYNSLPKEVFYGFQPATLGLGDVSREGVYVQATAVIFDLEGFTAFCNQVDSHLVIPEFLRRYLGWMFDTIRRTFKEGETADRVTIWGGLPFFVKFMGDGLLLIWDNQYIGRVQGIRNIGKRLYEITQDYSAEFLPTIATHVANPPKRLRCGVARGQIVAVGNGEDYVGSCINIAARLQKLAGLKFAVSRRGFDLSDVGRSAFWNNFVLRRVELRGIGAEELIYVHKDDLASLSRRDLKLLRDVASGA